MQKKRNLGRLRFFIMVLFRRGLGNDLLNVFLVGQFV